MDGSSSFKVHAKLLASSSDFFKATLKPEWLRGDYSVKLLDQSPEAFKIYINWLYSLSIRSIVPQDTTQSEWIELANCIVLGEALLDVKFKDTVIDALAKKSASSSKLLFKGPVALQAVTTIYDGTPTGSKAREFFVDLAFRVFSPLGFHELQPNLPREFLEEYSMACTIYKKVESINEFAPWKSHKCWYHSHAANQPCSARFGDRSRFEKR